MFTFKVDHEELSFKDLDLNLQISNKQMEKELQGGRGSLRRIRKKEWLGINITDS